MNCRLYQLLRPFVIFLLKAVYGIKVINKENIPKEGPILLVGNHKHNYDFVSVMCGTKRVIHFLAKKELIDKHGWLFRHLSIIPVDRSKKNKEAIDTAVNILKMNKVIGIFPEGTLNKTEYIIMPFKYGTVKIAKESKAPIVPFAIVGEYKRFKKGLKIIFGKPYYIEDSSDLIKENIKLMNKVIDLMKGEKNAKAKE